MKRLALGVLALVLLASGCSLGPREDWAKAMRDAIDTAEDTGGATVKQSVEVSVIETNIRQKPEPLIARSTGIVDFGAGRARLLGSAPRKTEVVYDDLRVYALRSKASAVDKRAWASFDYLREPSEDIDDNDRRMAVGAGLISPAVAIEVLEGVLTGSIKEHGTGTKAGVQATRYSARLAPDAAITEIDDEDRREGVTRMFATLGVQQDDFPVDVWLDGENRVRGLTFNMRQQKDRVNAFKMKVSWEFTDYGPTNEITTPDTGAIFATRRFRDFITELIREFA